MVFVDLDFGRNVTPANSEGNLYFNTMQTFEFKLGNIQSNKVLRTLLKVLMFLDWICAKKLTNNFPFEDNPIKKASSSKLRNIGMFTFATDSTKTCENWERKNNVCLNWKLNLKYWKKPYNFIIYFFISLQTVY